ncbi:MAG: tetratricopeptide repeat protein [Nitrospira sp.]|nr:tetratricopeptide repeat protein [Nitrospira sp.]MBX3341005.1 tetratricopeptide repeat protein [Nitrospira sp.]MBX3371394.1 tetratricopeptide repeat protein [Nitrospira sp.]HMU29797.1 tetratricopeptide repeat protein [Nitrospira sp.]HNA86539.1 tetratricopeptide repeat protein [Nitrospira sp.]
MIGFWFLLLWCLPAQAWAVSPGDVTPTTSPNQLSGRELLRIGEVHDKQEHWPETLTYYQLALSKFREKKQQQGIATTLMKIARVHERQGKLQDAHASLREAEQLFAQAADRSAHAEALLAMGRVAAQLGQRDESRDALTKAAALFTRVRNARGWNETMVQLGLLQVVEGSADAGLSSLQQAAEEARTRRHVDQQFTATVALGDAHWLLGRLEEARTHYLDALALAQAEHHLPFEGMLHLRLARLDQGKDTLNDRVALGKRAIQIAQAIHDTAAEAEAWSLLADLHRQLGQQAEADTAEMRALALYRSRELFVHGVQ